MRFVSVQGFCVKLDRQVEFQKWITENEDRLRKSSPKGTEYGGVYVEGPHDGGPAHDTQKEFWQQAETLIGMLDGCALFGLDPYWTAYEAVHRFVFDKVVNREVGEWWPLLRVRLVGSSSKHADKRGESRPH